MKKRLNKNRRRTNETRVLIDAALSGSRHAVRESTALGLTIKFISHRNIVEKLATGETKIIRKIKESPVKDKGLKKDTILWRK